MTAFMLSGLMVVLCTLTMLARMNIRRWLGYAGFVDIGFTLILLLLFSGTYGGVVAAAFAGLWMSFILQVLRKTMGVERYSPSRVAWYKGFYRFHWTYYAPSQLTWLGMKKETTA